MNKINKIALFIALLVVLSALSFGQGAFTTTTTTQTVGSNSSIVCLASLTGVTAQNGPQGIRTVLFMDREAMSVQSILNTSTGCVQVVRGYHGTYGGPGLSTVSHNVGITVYVGPDDPYHFNGSANTPGSPSLKGACVATQLVVLPVIELATGKAWTCAGSPGQWGVVEVMYVPPTQCTFAPTTLTQTSTYPQIGASNIFVLNSVTNAAAGTDTLTCTILPPTGVGTGQGAVLLDVNAYVGSQTVAPTSVGTATLGTITFPAAATSETASTVTPVALGGTITTVSPTAITTVTTAGSFLTIKSTPGTYVNLNTDRQVIQYTLPLLQSAASAMTVNTPGLIVHYMIAPPLSVN